jgi:hypothetical protein
MPETLLGIDVYPPLNCIRVTYSLSTHFMIFDSSIGTKWPAVPYPATPRGCPIRTRCRVQKEPILRFSNTWIGAADSWIGTCPRVFASVGRYLALRTEPTRDYIGVSANVTVGRGTGGCQ